MLCPKCEKLIGVGEERCPFCGAWQPSLYGYAPALQRLFGKRLDLMSMIVTTCIVLYVAALALEPSAIFRMRGVFDILSPGTRALYQLGMTGGLAWQQHWWWTLFTATYLHGSILHIFFNVMWIRSLGPAVNEFYGPARGFVIFSIAGALGFLVSNVASGTPTVGASASIFGLLAALLAYGRRTGSTVITSQLLPWAVIMFVMGFLSPGINNWAHAGGFAGGWITASVLPLSHERRESPAFQVLALVLLAITAVGFVLSFWKVTSIMLAS